MQSTPFFILSHSSPNELWDRIKKSKLIALVEPEIYAPSTLNLGMVNWGQTYSVMRNLLFPQEYTDTESYSQWLTAGLCFI